jgi:hypothetical protein
MHVKIDPKTGKKEIWFRASELNVEVTDEVYEVLNGHPRLDKPDDTEVNEDVAIPRMSSWSAFANRSVLRADRFGYSPNLKSINCLLVVKRCGPSMLRTRIREESHNVDPNQVFRGYCQYVR